MSLVDVLDAWGSAWAAFMLRSLLEATALLAVLLLAWLMLRRRMSSQLAYGLFLLVLVKAAVPIPVLVPAALARFVPARAVERRTVAPATVPVVARDEMREDWPGELFSSPEIEPAIGETTTAPKVGSAPIPTRPKPLPGIPSTPALLMLTWLAVVLGLTVRLASVHLRMIYRLWDAVPLDPATMLIDLSQVSKHCGLRREVPLIVTPMVAAPAVWGLVRPRVLFPPGLIDALSPGQLTWVLLHELVHVRRRDGWVALFQRLVQLVHFFHPAVWVANRIIDIQREFACDDAALALAGDVSRRDCGAGFLAIIERASFQPGTIKPALGLFGTHIFLRRRLMRILDTGRPLHQRLSARGALLLGVAALVALPDVRAQDKPPRPAPREEPLTSARNVPPARPAALRVRGKVLDARTGQPIGSFTLIPGHWAERAAGPVIWQRDENSKALTGGCYDEAGFLPVLDRGRNYALRVEAPGYVPGEFFGREDDADEIENDFRLVREGPGGIVHTPDGRPATGAVVVRSPRDDAWRYLQNGRFPESVFRVHDACKTGPDGRYAFQRETGPASMTVVHDAGFAYRSPAEIAISQDVILEPWGRIEGVVRLGKNPGSELDVGANVVRPAVEPWSKSRNLADLMGRRYFTQATADAEGRFVLDRVVPGQASVYRLLPREGGGFVFSHEVHVDVPPGGTAKVVLAGTGRPVVGRFIGPDGTVPTIRFENATGQLLIRAPLPRPPDNVSSGARRRLEWQVKFRTSAEGQALERMNKHFGLVITRDGAFHADDVPPGKYQFTLTLHERLVEGKTISFKSSQLLQRVVNVPAADPGHADEPFDVGDVVLAPKDHRGPEVGDAVPALLARTLDDTRLSLADYRGKYVLLDFWATWCAPCRAETPHLKAVFEAFGKDEHFVMLGLSVDNSVKPLEQYVVENGLGWTQAFLGRGPSEHATVDFGVHGIPSIWLIGPDGKVVAKGLRGDAIKKAVAGALAEMPR
jgi:beta-lactamase regulating signal transducer with metallopeptidase domain/thiol-disulfide isomerase/thioredoxin